MDRIAVISDIHGNIPALNAVLTDIEHRGIQRIFCLGDLVGKGPQPELVVDRVREVCDSVVQGNWDHLMTKEDVYESTKWHQKQLGESRLSYLQELPFSMEFMMSGRLIRLFHASSTSVYHRVHPDDLLSKRLAMFDNTPQTASAFNRSPDVVGYGDIHNAYLQHIDQKTLFNTGSVSNAMDLPQAAYAILEGKYNCDELTSFSIQLVRVPYDIELAIQIARNLQMPELDTYIHELTTATSLKK